MTADHRADVVVIGGGIMGLWTRALFAKAGYGVLLIEKSCLGDGQTIRSQGILHRGLKYGLSRSARETSEQLEEAGEIWDRSLRGEGECDLRSARVLSPCTWFWTVDGGAFVNLTAQIGVRWLLKAQTRPRELARSEFPAAFAASPASVRVWQVAEPVLDSSTLVAAVRDAGRGPILLGDVTFLGDHGSGQGAQVEATLHNGEVAQITAGAVVLAAGEGNEHLLNRAELDGTGVSQRRPLHMAILDHAPFDLFGHVPRAGSDKPRITVTTGRRGAARAWYVGGDVAERGVGQDDATFREAALAEIEACVPWADLSRSRFSSLRVDRAEGRTQSGQRPGGPIIRRFGRLIAAWPTKLALAPIAARQVLDSVREIAGGPTGATPIAPSLAAETCDLPWDEPGRSWTPIAAVRGVKGQ